MAGISRSGAVQRKSWVVRGRRSPADERSSASSEKNPGGMSRSAAARRSGMQPAPPRMAYLPTAHMSGRSGRRHAGRRRQEDRPVAEVEGIVEVVVEDPVDLGGAHAAGQERGDHRARAAPDVDVEARPEPLSRSSSAASAPTSYMPPMTPPPARARRSGSRSGRRQKPIARCTICIETDNQQRSCQSPLDATPWKHVGPCGPPSTKLPARLPVLLACVPLPRSKYDSSRARRRLGPLMSRLRSWLGGFRAATSPSC